MFKTAKFKKNLLLIFALLVMSKTSLTIYIFFKQVSSM